MILTTDQLSNIVLNNPNRDLIKIGRGKCKSLRMHMYGEGLNEHLKVIPGFEKPWMRALRVEYTRNNKDLFARLDRPTDKVYEAKGGSIYLNLPDMLEKKAAQLADNVINGYSVRGWIENYWRPHYKDDPCGVIMMEVMPKQQAIQARQRGESFVYPTYKSILCVHDYQPKGIMLDYISFELDKNEMKAEGYTDQDKVFRVIDDAYDYFVKVVGDAAVVDWGKTLVNLFGMVPAIINSDIINPIVDGSFLSFYDDIISLADEFLLKGSIKVTSDFRHGFPKYAEYANDCNKCNGEGYIEGDKCPECKGNGKAGRVYVSDTKLLPYPDDKDKPVVKPSEVGGFVEPSMNFHTISISDMTMLETYMNITMWGTVPKIKTDGMAVNQSGVNRTATEAMGELKPESARLTPISKTAEKRHKFILDQVVRLQVTLSYAGSSVNYGRRYMLESPDALWLKYKEARANGVAIGALDELLRAYYEAEYSSDPLKLAVQVKLMKVEPFVHYKISEVLTFMLSDAAYKAKLYYGEWLSVQNSATLYALNADDLRTSLYAYAAAQELQKPEPKPIAF